MNSPPNITDWNGLESPSYDIFSEKLHALRFPVAALEAKKLADKALQTTQERFPGSKLHNDKADAWRHCYWSALMRASKKIRSGSYFVSSGEFGATYTDYDVPYEIGLAHEKAGNSSGQPEIEYAMDMHNNNVGLQIGDKLGKGASDKDIIEACDKALQDGNLIFIEDGKLTKAATYQVITRYERVTHLFSIELKPVYTTVETNDVGKPKK